jgi:hypothetical protein
MGILYLRNLRAPELIMVLGSNLAAPARKDVASLSTI